MTADRFRHAYAEARDAGFNGTRAEFASLVTSCPQLFRGGIVAGARAWERGRGDAPMPQMSPARGQTLLAVTR